MVFTATDGTQFEDRSEWRRHEFRTRYTFKGNKGETLSRKPGEIDGQPFNLEELEDCQVLLLDHSDQLQVDYLKRCKLFIGPSSESVFVRDCEDCTFTIACKQLRTRDCKNCTFYLYSQSDPIIETSDGIRFGPFNGAYPMLNVHFERAGLIADNNHWRAVFDFNAPGDVQGPGNHWDYIPEAEWGEDWTHRPEGVPGEPVNPVPRDARARFDEDGNEITDAMRAEGAAGGGSGMKSFSIKTSQADAQAVAPFTAEEEKQRKELGMSEEEFRRALAAAPREENGGAKPKPKPKPTPAPAPAPALAAVTGDRVDAKFKGSKKHYPGIIAGDNGDGTFDVKFDDGDRDTAVPAANIIASVSAPPRPVESVPPAPPSGVGVTKPPPPAMASGAAAGAGSGSGDPSVVLQGMTWRLRWLEEHRLLYLFYHVPAGAGDADVQALQAARAAAASMSALSQADAKGKLSLWWDDAGLAEGKLREVEGARLAGLLNVPQPSVASIPEYAAESVAHDEVTDPKAFVDVNEYPFPQHYSELTGGREVDALEGVHAAFGCKAAQLALMIDAFALQHGIISEEETENGM